MKELKAGIKEEMKRRNSSYGSLEEYGDDSYDFLKEPQLGDLVYADYGMKTINLLLKICDIGDGKLAEIKESGDFLNLNFVNLLKEALTKFETETKTSSSSCRAMCTGLCSGSCISECSGCTGSSGTYEDAGASCKGNCTSECTTACSVTCGTGCGGCNTECGGGCVTSCNTGCYSTCKNGCYDTCTSACTSC